VALSTAEAEYMGIGGGVQESLWICQLLQEVLGPSAVKAPSNILCDNQAVLAITRDDKHHAPNILISNIILLATMSRKTILQSRGYQRKIKLLICLQRG
jgi:hypothetical protein